MAANHRAFLLLSNRRALTFISDIGICKFFIENSKYSYNKILGLKVVNIS